MTINSKSQGGANLFRKALLHWWKSAIVRKYRGAVYRGTVVLWCCGTVVQKNCRLIKQHEGTIINGLGMEQFWEISEHN